MAIDRTYLKQVTPGIQTLPTTATALTTTDTYIYRLTLTNPTGGAVTVTITDRDTPAKTLLSVSVPAGSSLVYNYASSPVLAKNGVTWQAGAAITAEIAAYRVGVRNDGGPATWYVDSVNGNDSWPGTSPLLPLKTIGALNNKPVLSGDTILLKRGSYWRETLNLLNKTNVVVDAYGGENGEDKPVLDCSDVIPNASFTLTAGKTKVYEVTVPIETPATGATWLNVWEDGVYLARAASVDACEATPGTYYPSTEASSPVTLYIHPTGDQNPITNGKTYEYSARKHGIICDNGASIRRVHTKKNLDSYGSLCLLGTNSEAIECDMTDGGIHNGLITPPGRIIRCRFINAYAGGNALIMFVHFKATPDGSETMYYEDCYCENFANLNLSTGFGGHRGPSGTFGDATYVRCGAKNLSSGFSLQHGNGVFKQCYLDATSFGFTMTGSQTYTIDDCYGQVVERWVNIPSSSNNTAIVSRNKIVCTNTGAGTAFTALSGSNTFVVTDSSIDSRSAINANQTNMVITFRNNYVKSISSYVFQLQASVTLDAQHNQYYGFTNFTIGGASLNKWQYVAQTGQDTLSFFN